MALSAPILHDHPGTTDQEKDICLGHDARQESAYVPLQRAGTVCASACVGAAVIGTIRGCVLKRTCVGDAQPPYVMEHANAQWYVLANYRGIILIGRKARHAASTCADMQACRCEKTGFPAHIVQGSHGLAVLKGPQTDEEVVAKAWGTREASITVVHYTGTGIPVNHTVQIFPLFDEQSGKLTHFLGVSSFEKYITKGQLQIRAKAVMNANVMRAITGGKKDKQTAEGHDSDNAAAATNSEERAKQLQQRASLLLKKNAHDLRKENALKNLDKYAGILSQSNRSQVPLVTLREKEREREALNAAAQTQSVGSNADRLNAFKSRLQVAKRQAKRDKRNRAATPGSLSAVSHSPRTAAESAPPTSEPSRLATAATRTDAVVRIVEVS